MSASLTRWAGWLGLVMGLCVPVAVQALTVRAAASCTAGADRDAFGLHDTDISFGIMCLDRPDPDVSAGSDAAVGVDASRGTATLLVQSWAVAAIRGGGIRSSASASAFFEVQTIIGAAPPFMPDFLPVDLLVSGQGSTRVGSQGGAALTDLGGHLLFDHGWAGDDPGSGFDDAVDIFIEPGRALGLGKGVSCVSQAVFVGSPNDVRITGCSVSFDPVAVFDQAEFDRTWGAASFRLDQYFSLNLAPPVSVGVPEPSAALLLLVGLAALGRTPARRSLGREPA